tara:strand:- start:1341 stop:2039 length:699 start_codon:yes stop_codon:yes gene_type:complete
MDNFKNLKEEAYNANIALYEQGLVIYTFGNVSAVNRSEKVFAIKPSGVPYKELTPQKMVVVDFENNIIEGNLRPSSDTKTHAYLYQHWEDIGGIAHTHALYSVAWAQSLRDIPIFGTTHADHLTQDVPCAPPMDEALIKGDYEHNTGKQIFDCFNNRKLNYNKVEMVLVGNHGPFCWGADAQKAVFNSRVLEEIAHMAYLTLQINPKSEKLKATLIDKHYQRKHGTKKYYGQ